jgi:hypothetical protein
VKLTKENRVKLRRALERRFGQSMLPLQMESADTDLPYGRWLCRDLENGAEIIAVIQAGRLRVIAEKAPNR